MSNFKYKSDLSSMFNDKYLVLNMGLKTDMELRSDMYLKLNWGWVWTCG